MQPASSNPLIESADYHVEDTLAFKTRMKFMTRTHQFYATFLDWISTLCVSFVISLIVTCIHGVQIRNVYIQQWITQDTSSLGYAFMVDVMMMTGMVAMACLLTAWQPASTQSGIPGIISFLNGIRIPYLLASKTILAKSLGIILSITSGLALGTAGPLIHIGGGIGYQINKVLKSIRTRLEHSPRFHPFRSENKSHDGDERDMVAIGAGCGLSAAFGVSIGGAMFVMEEASSILDIKTIQRAFVACYVGFAMTALFRTMNNTYSFLAERPSNPLCDNRKMTLTDILFFALMGMMGGMLGSLFNKTVVYLTSWSHLSIRHYHLYQWVPPEYHVKMDSLFHRCDEVYGRGKRGLVRLVQRITNKGTWTQLESPNTSNTMTTGTTVSRGHTQASVTQKICLTLLISILACLIRIFSPLLFDCIPADARLFMDHPSMCFGLSNERRLFSGFAYFPQHQHINTTVFTSQTVCERFSRQESLENIQSGQSHYVMGGQDDRRDEAEDDLSADSHRLIQDWKEWGAKRPGFKVLGKMLPLPLPGVYDSRNSTNKTHLAMPLVWTAQYTCPPGYFNPMASLLLNTINRSIRLLFVRGSIMILPSAVLFTYFILNGILIVLVVSVAFIPAGSFLPQMVLGATYGRLVGIAALRWSEYTCKEWIYLPYLALTDRQRTTTSSCLSLCAVSPDPTLYAMVGSASFMGGVTRSPLFLSVIMAELTNDLDTLPAIALGVLVAVWVGNLFNKGLYYQLIHKRKMDFLDPEPPLCFEGQCITALMTAPVIVLPRYIPIDLQPIQHVLDTTTHHGFPIVESLDHPLLLGIISKKKLQRLLSLKHKDSHLDSVQWISEHLNQKEQQKYLFTRRASQDEHVDSPSFIKSHSCDDIRMKVLKSNAVLMGPFLPKPSPIVPFVSDQVLFKPSPTVPSTSPPLNPLDLTEYMDTSPFSVPDTFSLPRAYRLFRNQGLRHLIIVNKQNWVVGIVTRKDLTDIQAIQELNVRGVDEMIDRIKNSNYSLSHSSQQNVSQ